MATVTKTVDVNLPVRHVYNQWTQFESFPQFMEGVKEVKQIDETDLRWHAEIAGMDEEWTAKITEQTPDQRIAWTSTSGAHNAGVVTFHKLDESTTRVTLQMEYAPESAAEEAGDALGMLDRRIDGDLLRFKDFMEERGQETGAWRGEVRQNS